MKKSVITVYFLFVAAFLYGQHQVITVNGDTINSKVRAFNGESIYFFGEISKLKSDKIHISEVSKLIGYIPNARQKDIINKKPNIIFIQVGIPNDYEDEILSQNVSSIPYETSSYNIIGGINIEEAGYLYLSSTGAALVGSGLLYLGARSDKKELMYLGGAISIGGFVAGIIGHTKLVAAGRAFKKERISLNMALNGISLAVKF